MAKRFNLNGRNWRRYAIWTAGTAAGVVLVGFIALLIAVYSTAASLPSFDSLKSSPNGQMIRVHAADGTVIVSLGPSYGEWISFQDTPKDMREAMVSIEDRRFYSHFGIDLRGMARALMRAMSRDRSRMEGASTITQQVARTIFLNNKYDIRRKIREAVLALALEHKFTKDQILELYLNKVYFGGGAYGIDAASRKFFGHDARHLSLAESAVIAGMAKAPSRYSPTADAQAAIDRATTVLKVMEETKAITPEQAAETNPKTVALAPEPKQNSVRYFTDWALPQLEVLIDENDAPLEVWTTLDLNMQRVADDAIRGAAPRGAQGALISLDRDGAVRAMVGGTDYVSSNYNRATTAVRQPGSAWKLFVYLAALEAGHKPDDMTTDEPITIGNWSPRNSSGHFSGPMSLRTAFAYSVNTVAARLGQEVGFSTVADMARRFGITTPIDSNPAMVLGTNNVRLIDMTRAFASVSQKGVAVTPYGITRVTANGAVIYQHEVDTSHVLVAPYVAAEMTDLLQTAVNTGTGKAAQIGRPVAGKTGTTTSNKDGWFLGFSSGLTTGVWMGRDDARPVPGLQGGTAPARAFSAFMSKAVASRPIEPFDTKLVLPDLGIEPDDQAYFGGPDNGAMVDPNGNPLPPDRTPPADGQDQSDQQDGAPPPDQGRINQQFLDRALGRTPQREPNRTPQGPNRYPQDPRYQQYQQQDGAPPRNPPPYSGGEDQPALPNQ